jgi:hypothetical protein
MSESVPVRCPACGREHRYTAPTYRCVCGAPVVPALDRHGAATAVTHESWEEGWVALRCAACGRGDHWPRPELGCPCGTLLRVPMARTSGAARTATRPERRRSRFRPVTIHTARDAVTAAAVYLRWLGYRDIRRADQRPPSGIGIAARGLVAQVDPASHPASLRDVECLWLTAMTESANGVYFSLAGYADEAHTRAGTLGIALFVLDLTGTPQPVNGPADELDAAGA